ncbi:MAG: hypothetical protein NC253_11110 [Ruminococcus sp.]|nr:hypothetical protein [Ruminococcus sp.]MCM1380304.1 hypothetical protein [Muribaculaceae bacterium]MCM1478284.1 hypothetical protein [Muribaculaceae bacterium]
MIITEQNIRKILVAAIKSEVLILTADASEAEGICAEIYAFASYTLGIKADSTAGAVFTGAYNPIFVCSADKWNGGNLPYCPFKRAYSGDFDGCVLCTDKSIASGLTGIADGVTARYLPADHSAGACSSAEIIEQRFQAILDGIQNKIEKVE